MKLAGKSIGNGHPCYIIGEVGINASGSVGDALDLIDVIADSGCDAVKFQKRVPRISVPEHMWDTPKDTPWGRMTYIEYKERMEFTREDFVMIAEHCQNRGITWSASAWDAESVGFLEDFEVPWHKVPSAKLTDHNLLRAMRETGKPVILSTGMSTLDEVNAAVEVLGRKTLVILHCHSAYPTKKASELNLRVIQTLAREFAYVGYSGHEPGLCTTVAAVALGACVVERHVTLDRASWGTDQAASVEPMGLRRLVRDIRTVEESLGDGVKRVWPSEIAARKKLRGA